MSRSSRFLFCILAFIPFLFGLSGCRDHSSASRESDRPASEPAGSSQEPLQTVKLLPYWITTAQFAGYYIGIEEGIFKKYGIDLQVIPYHSAMQPDQMIRNHEADFYLLWLVNAIDLKDSGLDLVNIAQLSSRSSLMLIAKKSSGIESVAGMEGKRAAIWSDYTLQPQALFRKHHVDVEIIPIGSSNNLFLTDGVDIINASWFDEYHSILNCGYNPDELETFFFADHGLNFLEDGIYCLRSTLEKDSGLCRRFVEATLESWKFAFEHPDVAIRLVLDEQRKQNMPASRSHQQWMLDRYRDLYFPDSSTRMNTALPQEAYKQIARILLEAGLIGSIPPFDSFYHPVLQPADNNPDKQTSP